MTTYVELNDFCLRALHLQNAQLQVIHAEPAAVAFRDKSLVFGQPAIAVSRTLPQQFNQRYLMAFNSQPLPVPVGPARNFADLAYHHLRSLDIQGDVIMGVPGCISNDQLGFLLGICNEAGIAVRRFVDTALLHALSAELENTCHVLDIELHRLVLTEFAHQDGALTSTQCTSLDGLGAVHILEGWMGAIADEFVHHTRFDPLHAGATEQQLYDQLQNWLSPPVPADNATTTLAPKPLTRVVLGTGSAQHELEINPQLLTNKLAQRLDSLQLQGVVQLAVTARVQQFPGLVEFLRSRVQTLVLLDENNLAESLQVLTQNLSDNVQRLSQAPADAVANVSGPSQPPAPSTAASTLSSTEHVAPATHLLTGAIAHPLQAFADYLDPDTGAVRDAAMILEGPATAHAVVVPGATVRIDAIVYQAIRVV